VVEVRKERGGETYRTRTELNHPYANPLTTGGTAALASVAGPIEAGLREELPDKASRTHRRHLLMVDGGFSG
jgi:hypothetical protein